VSQRSHVSDNGSTVTRDIEELQYSIRELQLEKTKLEQSLEAKTAEYDSLSEQIKLYEIAVDVSDNAKKSIQSDFEANQAQVVSLRQQVDHLEETIRLVIKLQEQ
jgi:predicted nuclease with TOPRIM domain